ncbi:MBL fold metallo-hydrolase [Palleronia pelagia]|uniref:Glyoxylase, beta-lactamase superfamily II n=1 Tax=Palleronia pelagia TaxID=387096 RepID=A0A1H8AMW6_9RHOB|nr:MBL fold metallo-hydrolase [Palleronia pelagia]SEM71856.1 Glyoxylase, beta-lactamase superfamily II [Palleronia pelagia]
MITRRHLMGSAAAATALPFLPRAARAAAHSAAPVLPAAQRFTIGDMAVTALSDGALRIGPEALQGIDAEGYAQAMTDQFIEPDAFRAAVNAFLIEAGDTKMLVDAGTGGAMGPDLGRLMGNLEATGTAPEDITMILASHLHPDHVGGAVDGGSAIFPNAELAFHEAERAFWTDDAIMQQAGESNAMFFNLARSVLDVYGDRLRPFSGEGEVAPGITAMPLPGHTPGHTGFAISSGDDSLLIWADILHVAPVQLRHPEVTIGFDVDPDQAAATRADILDRVVADRMLIAGSHINFPGLGHIMQAGEGYAMIDARYPYPA